MDFCMYPRYEVLQLCRIQVIIVAGCSTKFCHTIFQPKYVDEILLITITLKTCMTIIYICKILSMYAFNLYFDTPLTYKKFP